MVGRLRKIAHAALGSIVLTVSVGGCTTSTALPLSAAAQQARLTGEYKLGVGDKLRINVYNERDLRGEFQVTGGGIISMPLIGNIQAGGLSARELEAALVTRLKDGGFLIDPTVAVEVYAFRPIFVLGEVERPGSFVPQEGTTILGAIANAGGFTYRANTRGVFIRGVDETQEYEVDPNQPLKILPGDIIRVGERHF